MLILLRFSVTDYRKQRHRKSRLQKQKRQKREDWKPTRHILWREKVTRKISGRRERTIHSSPHYRKRRQHWGVSFKCWSQIIPRSRTLGKLVLPYARSGLATEWFLKTRWDSHRKNSFSAKMFRRKRIWLRNHKPAFTHQTETEL